MSRLFDDRGLWSLLRVPDPMHLILNHSPKLQHRRCIASMYAGPAQRSAKGLLRFATDCFVHTQLWIANKMPMNLAEHFLLAHMPYVYHQLAPSLALRIQSDSASCGSVRCLSW